MYTRAALPAGTVGWVQSPLTDRDAAPKQGDAVAPVARVVLRPELREAMADLCVGDEVLVRHRQWARQLAAAAGRGMARSPDALGGAGHLGPTARWSVA